MVTLCDDPAITGKLRNLALVMSASIPTEVVWRGRKYRVREMLLEALEDPHARYRVKEELEAVEREMELAVLEVECDEAERLIPLALGIKRAVVILKEPPSETSEIEDIKRWLKFGGGLIR